MPDYLEGESQVLSSLQPGDRFMLTANTVAVRGCTFVVNSLSEEEELIELEGEFTVHSQKELILLYSLGLDFALIRERHMGYILPSTVSVERLD